MNDLTGLPGDIVHEDGFGTRHKAPLQHDLESQGMLDSQKKTSAWLLSLEEKRLFLDKGAEVNAQGGSYGNALQAASRGGHGKLVQMLLDKGAEVNAQGGYYGNALQAASQGGHEKLVQILFDKGAEVNAQGGDYGNALQAASQDGHEKLIQMLLDKGAEVNNKVKKEYCSD